MDKTLTYIKIHLLRTLMLVAMMVWGVGESWGQAVDSYLQDKYITNIGSAANTVSSAGWYLVYNGRNYLYDTNSSFAVGQSNPGLNTKISTSNAGYLIYVSGAYSGGDNGNMASLKSGLGHYVSPKDGNYTKSSSILLRNDGGKIYKTKNDKNNGYTFLQINNNSLTTTIYTYSATQFSFAPVTLKYKTSLTLTPSYNSDGNLTLAATLTAEKTGANTVTGQTIKYMLADGTECTNGVVPADIPDGNYVVTATFDGNDDYVGSTATFSFTKSSTAASPVQVTNTLGITLNGLNSANTGVQFTQTGSVTGSYIPAYVTYTYGGASHNVYDGADHNNSTPSAVSLANGTTYSWSITGGADYATISNTGLVTATSTPSNGRQTITVALTATNGSFSTSVTNTGLKLENVAVSNSLSVQVNGNESVEYNKTITMSGQYSGNYTPAYTNYVYYDGYDGKPHYVYNGRLVDGPYSITSYSGTGCQIKWSLSGDGADSATIDESTGVLTNTGTPTSKNVVVTATVTHPDYPELSLTGTKTVTILGRPFAITKIADAQGGSWDVSATSASAGTEVSLYFYSTPNDYVFDKWVVKAGNDEVPVTLTNGNNGKFTMPASDVTVTVAFKDKVFPVNISESSGGTVTASPANAAKGQTVTLTATPDDDHTFTNIAANWSVKNEWGGDIEVTIGTGNTCTFVMPTSVNNYVTATATFKDKIAVSDEGYVFYTGTNYLNSSKSGTETFNPKSCLWRGNSGGNFKTEEVTGLQCNYNGIAYGSDQLTLENVPTSGTTGGYISYNKQYYLRYNNGWTTTQTKTNSGTRVVFPVTKYSYPEYILPPLFYGADSFNELNETNEYLITQYPEYNPAYFDYVFYNGAHHYCLTETSDAAEQPIRQFDYSWSLSCSEQLAHPLDYYVKVDGEGNVTYKEYFESETDVILTLTATSKANDKTYTVNKTIHFYVSTESPTGVSAENLTVYRGLKGTLNVTLEPQPCYKKLAFSSDDENVATVNATTGEVTGVGVGTATITIKAYAYNSTTEFISTTAIVTVKDKVATPEISFAPNGLTAMATITSGTTGAKIYYTVNGDEPTTGSTEYTDPFIVNNLDVVRAIAVMPNSVDKYELWDTSAVATATYSAQKVPTPEIRIRGNEVTFDCDEPGVTYRYTTDGSIPTATSGTVWDGNVITNISVGSTIKVIATKTGFSPSEVAEATMRKANVVYLRLAGAQGNGSGSSAANAVGTWANAFAKLGYGPNAKYLRSQWKANNVTGLQDSDTGLSDNTDYTSTVDNNIIYLVGDVSSSQLSDLMGQTAAHPQSESGLMSGIVKSGFFKPVTISGKYANSSKNTEKYAQISINAGTKYTLNEDMRFEYVEFHGNNGTNSTDFMLAYYDLEMGEGIIMTNFLSTKDFSTYHHGYAQGVTNTAHILFYGGLTNDARFGHTDNRNAELNFDYYLPHPDGYKITIRSGYFSTISPGGTQWSQYNNDLNGTMGSPNTPVKCTITVDIDRAWNTAHQSGVLGNTANGNPDCDLAVVIAGTHEGSMYGDVDIVVKSGRIDRVVNGTFGANNFVGNYPSDSYFGRANILIDPREPSSTESGTYSLTKNSMVVIRELYGGGLGRFKSDSDKGNQSSTYFYGKSSVVINGGTFSSALYASGAGGVNGVGDDNHYTPDTKLPYWNGNNIAYGTYAQFKSGRGTKPFVVKCRNADGTTEEVDLYNTSAKIEIHGGVFGTASAPASIYGGGYGFVDKELSNR